jgi:hypothetical protein
MHALRHVRVWLVYLPVALIVLLAGAWAASWYFQSSLTEKMMAGWREREAREGRTYTCGKETIAGFPFRLDMRCTDPSAELTTTEPPVVLKAKEVLVASEVSQPTEIITTFTAPLTISAPGQPPSFETNWTLGKATVRGTPEAPEGISIEFGDPIMKRFDGGSSTTVLKAKQIELQGRITEGSAASNPVIDMALHLVAASAPDFNPLTVQPLDADLNVQMRGLADFEPKSWPQRFREMQVRRGSIDISKARVQQGELIAVGTGTLGLTASGTLDGEIRVTIVGLEKVLQSLDPDHVLQMLNLDQTVSRKDIDQTLDVLDQFMPGFGQFARQNAAPSIVAGLGAIGENTTLEGKPAVTLPLRFMDGAAFLGPIPIGSVPSLF